MPEMDRRLAAAEKAAVAEELLGKLRHDVRNKLGSVRNATFYLRRKVSTTPLWEEDKRVPTFLDLIERAVDEAQEQLAGLDGQRVYERRIDVVEVSPVIARLARHYGDRLRVELGDCSLEIDPTELELALRALIDNALDTGVEVVGLEAGPRGGHVRLTVHDRGPGIALDPVDRALEPFVTTREGRAGLGLSIVRRIARRYRGALELVETGPEGTRAELVFPAPSAT